MEDYEKLGKFYLGRGYDLEKGELRDELTLYDSKDLVTHGVVLGMTGSGKTGLCLALLEEAAMDGIPAIIIDPKGDIPNLMLTFPEFRAEDFRPWINEDDARKKGSTPEEFAGKTAEMWKNGLASWGQSPERVRQLQGKVDINVFTPGSNAGIPVSILSSLEVPPFEVMDDGELLGERIESTVSSLLSLVGVNGDPIQSPEAVLLGAVFQHCWRAEQNLTLETLIRHLQRPPFGKVGVIDLESFMAEGERQKLALRFNNLLASPGFATWLEGPPLDIQRMLWNEEGKPQVSIFSIAHLSDTERMFFVSLLLNQMLGWMRAQSGTTSLRALLYMDEIYGYLPPTANPPSKKPFLTLLKQARAFGLGVLAATQNPVDLDYKAMSNMGTWWLGRLQTERDKMRVLDGLEGAAAEGGGKFNRREMEQLLAGLDSRVFLMNNVHEDGPEVMHVRWVMSYLCGPLTRRQIKELMDPVREKFLPKAAVKVAAGNPMAMSAAKVEETGGERPVVGKGVMELFALIAGEAEGVCYRPHLLREAEVHFASTMADVQGSRPVRIVNPVKAGGIDWDHERDCKVPLKGLSGDPQKGARFEELPGYAMNEDNYKPVEEEFEEWIYRNERAEVFFSPLFDEYSRLGEGEGDFRARIALKAREVRDEAVEKLRDKYEKKIKTKEDQLGRADLTIEKEKAESASALLQTLGGLLGGLLGGRRSRGGTFSAGTRAYKQQRDVGIAKEKARALEKDVAELEEELREEVVDLEREYDPEKATLETIEIKPYKKDIDVKAVALLWLPYDELGDGVW